MILEKNFGKIYLGGLKERLKTKKLKKNKVIETTIAFVKEQFQNEPTGHDWFHIDRVVKLSEKIAQEEGGDLYKIKLIAFLHDISDYKLNENEKEGVAKLERFLNNAIEDESLRQQILLDIEGISFKGAEVRTSMLSKEGQIVQDADRLDAIGAIGIARAFAYGGNKKRSMYNPDEKPEVHQSFKDYKSSKGHTINHFYEKLLLLKDRLNTKTAKKIAQERHTFMESFLDQFYREWDVKP